MLLLRFEWEVENLHPGHHPKSKLEDESRVQKLLEGVESEVLFSSEASMLVNSSVFLGTLKRRQQFLAGKNCRIEIRAVSWRFDRKKLGSRLQAAISLSTERSVVFEPVRLFCSVVSVRPIRSPVGVGWAPMAWHRNIE